MLKIISILKTQTNGYKEEQLFPYISNGYKINSIIDKEEKKVITLPMGYHKEIKETYEVYYLEKN